MGSKVTYLAGMPPARSNARTSSFHPACAPPGPAAVPAAPGHPSSRCFPLGLWGASSSIPDAASLSLSGETTGRPGAPRPQPQATMLWPGILFEHLKVAILELLTTLGLLAIAVPWIVGVATIVYLIAVHKL